MNKKFTKLIAALALLVFMAPSMVGWGQTRDVQQLTNANIVAAGSGQDGYKSWTITDDNNHTWNAYAIKKAHSYATSQYHFLQIRKYASNTAYYIQVPELGTQINSITMTVSGSSQPMTDGGNSVTLYFSNSNSTSSTGTGVASGTGSSSVTINCSDLDLNTGYITANGAVRIWDISVTYTAGSTTYTVTYNANGGTGTLTDPNSPYQPNATVTVLANTFTKTGNTFFCWSDTPDGTGNLYDPDDNNSNTFPITQNTTLYAQWLLNQYNVAIEEVDNVDLHADMLGEGEDDDIDYGTEITLSYDNLSSGYAFSSWVITKNADGSNVTSQVLNGSTLTVPDYNITISATLIQVYTVNFNLNNGTFVANTDFPSDIVEKPAGTYTLPSATRSGYSFTGWSDGENTYSSGASYTVSGDVDFEAQWEESSEMELTFDLTSNPGGWPTTNSTTLENYTYTLSGVDYTFALKNVKCNSGYLMMTSTAVLGLPAIEGYKLTKVVASNSGSCSTSTQVGISSSASSANYIAGGSAQTWSTTGSQYTYTLTSTEENTMYYMYVTSKNAQVTSLALTYQAVGSTPAPQEYTLEVTNISNAEIYVFDATDPDETNWVYLFEGIDEVQVLEGTQIALSVVADEGYTIETLMVNNVDHAADITSGGTYTFNMPAENVTITVTTEEIVAPVVVNYVRITSLDQLTDGSKVIIAACYEEGLTNGYYAMPGETSGRPNGVEFTSVTSGDDQFLPAVITSSEDTYYWTVNVTDDGYTFTNANNQMIGWTSSTNFATGGNNTLWTITRETADEGAMVGEYTGFVIRNFNTDTRAFAFNGSAFGPYSTQNMDNSGYNFFLDFFVETYTKDIEGNQWYFIASPTGEAPSNLNVLTDLYYYDEQDHFWRNKKIDANADGFDFAIGKGYLCANADLETTPDPITLTFTGAPIANEVQEITLSYNETTTENEVNTLAGWNLVGNPFNCAATLDMDCYILSGTAINTTAQTAGSYTVGPCEGVMVKANEDGQFVTFTKATPGQTPQPNQLQMTVAQQVVTRNGASTGSATVEDNAIVSFNEGNRLEKFAFNADAAKLYIPQNDKEYAIVSAEAQGEMPVNFKAAENGTYTLSVDAENVEMNYLHLIDNMTGMDIDLLQTPSYTFEANTRDYESRFRLVFAGASTGSATDDNFAFFSNGNLIINNDGNATLQVIDLTGRILSSEIVNGSVSKTINATPGVYMLRLINGENVNVQKIVVR